MEKNIKDIIKNEVDLYNEILTQISNSMYKTASFNEKDKNLVAKSIFEKINKPILLEYVKLFLENNIAKVLGPTNSDRKLKSNDVKIEIYHQILDYIKNLEESFL